MVYNYNERKPTHMDPNALLSPADVVRETHEDLDTPIPSKTDLDTARDAGVAGHPDEE